MTATILADARLPDGRRADIEIRDGRIAHIRDAGTIVADGAPRIELGGALVLPGLVEGHIHLDKTLLGLPFIPHRPGDTVAKRIEAEKALRRELRHPVEERAMRLIEQVVGYGTVALRTHVDVDNEVKLGGLHALLKVKEKVRDLLDIQIVAFPQSGVVIEPGVANLLDAAVREGADLVGGLDPLGIDNDVEGQLDAIFGLAVKHGVGIDIHLHDPGSPGCAEIVAICARTEAAGLSGKVAISHAFALGSVERREFDAAAGALASAGVAIMTNQPGSAPMPPVKALREAGVTVFAGSDNIRDAWSPYGNGDMLERAAVIGYRQDFRGDDDLAIGLDLATHAAAKVLGLADYGLAEGYFADLIAVRAESVAEAVATHLPRLLVMKRGKIVARDGRPADL